MDTKVIQKILHHILFEDNEKSDKYYGKYYVDTDNVNYNVASEYTKYRYYITKIANQWLEKDPKLSSNPNHNDIIDRQILNFNQIQNKSSIPDIRNKKLEDFPTFGDLQNFIDKYDYILSNKPHKVETLDISDFKPFIIKWRNANPQLPDESINEALKEFMTIMTNQGKSIDEILATLETFPTFDKLTRFISQNNIYLIANNKIIKHWQDTTPGLTQKDISDAIQQFNSIRDWYTQNKIDIPLEYKDPYHYDKFSDLLSVIRKFKRNNIYNSGIKSKNILDKAGNRIYYSQHITNFQDLEVLLGVSSARSLRTKMTEEVFNFVYFVLNFDIYVFTKDQTVSSKQAVDDSLLLILVSPINNSPIVYAADGSDYTNGFNTYRTNELKGFYIGWDKNITIESKHVNYQSIDFSVPFQEGKINGTLVKSVKTNTVPTDKIQNITTLIPTMKTNVYLSNLLDILLNNENAKLRYFNNILDGECTFYYPHSDNIHKKINYVNGVPSYSEDGPSIVEYEKNGNKKNEIFIDSNNMIKSVYEFKDDKPHKFTSFSNNKPQGLHITYDSNGNYREVIHIKTKEMKTGYSFEYFDSEHVAANPVLVNISKMKLKSKSYFENGVKKWSVTYDKDGNIVSKDNVPQYLDDRKSTLKDEYALYDQYLKKSRLVNVEHYPSGQIKSISYVHIDTVADGIQISFLGIQADKYFIDEIAYYKNNKIVWNIGFNDYQDEVTRTGNVDPRVLEIVKKYIEYLDS